MKKTILLLSAMLATGILSAAPANVQVNLWKSILRYHNSTVTLNFPYADRVGVQFEQNGYVCGGFRLALNEWKGDEKLATQVEDNGRTLKISWPAVSGAALQIELADDNTIAAAFTKPASVKQRLYFHFDRQKMEKNGKCVVAVDGQTLTGNFHRGGIKSVTFFEGDAAKTFSLKFGNNCAAIITVNEKSIDFSVSTFNADSPAEFTIIPGQE